MAVRNLDGVDDKVHCALGGCNLTGALTMAVLFKVSALGEWHALMGNHDSGGSSRVWLEIRNTNVLEFGSGGGSRATTATIVAGRWYIAVGRKAAGASVALLSLYDFVTNAWTHETIADLDDPPTQAGGTVRFGVWQTSDFWNGRLAVAGEWATLLSEAQVEELSDNLATLDWAECSGGAPVGLWDFNQAATSVPVEDLVGTSDETTLVGTTVVNDDDPLGWRFGLTPPPPAPPGVYHGVRMEGSPMRHG